MRRYWMIGLSVLMMVLFLAAKSWSTDITNHFYSDTTLTLAGSPYVFKQDTLIASGVTVTVEPGVMLLFDDGFGLTVAGRLIADGTAANPIMFQSSQPNALPGAWEQIYLLTGNNVLNHLQVRHSSFGLYQNLSNNDISNSLFTYNVHALTLANGGTGLIQDNTIANNTHGVLLVGWCGVSAAAGVAKQSV